MRRRRLTVGIALAITAAVLAVALVALVQNAPREPVYEGKPLRAWLGAFDANEDSSNRVAAQLAIRQMGTNALPFLIRYLRHRDPPYYVQFVNLKARLHLLRGGVDYETQWHRRAALACGELGVAAEPAFPALLAAANDPHAASQVANGLSKMLPNSAPVLTNILVTGNPVARARAADTLALGLFYPDLATMSRTVLTNALLRDPDAGVRMAAASALGIASALERAGHSPAQLDLIVPALTRALGDPNPSVRGNAATSLGGFGAKSKSAVPELLKLLQDTNDFPRTRAAEMLPKIDPEAAAEATRLVAPP